MCPRRSASYDLPPALVGNLEPVVTQLVHPVLALEGPLLMLIIDDDVVVVLGVRVDRRRLLAGDTGGERALQAVQSFVLDLDRLLRQILNLRRETLQTIARQLTGVVRRERLLQR